MEPQAGEHEAGQPRIPAKDTVSQKVSAKPMMTVYMKRTVLVEVQYPHFRDSQ